MDGKAESAEVVVYGGTPGGIACAVRCAREGLSVILVNVTQHLGGMLSSGLGLYDTNFRGIRSPLVQEIRDGVLRHYAAAFGRGSRDYRLAEENQTFEPHVIEEVLTRLVGAEARIAVLLGFHLESTLRDGRTIRAIRVTKAEGAEGKEIAGRMFVDASYEGDLAAGAGAPYRVGRESRSEYGEPHAGRIFTRKEDQHEETRKFPYEAANGLINLRPFDSCSGRLFPGSTGEGDAAVMAYNYRLCLSRKAANQIPFWKPRNYCRENYLGIVLNEKESLGGAYPLRSRWLTLDVRDFQFRNHREIPNGKISWNHGDFPGRNHSYPEADWPERRRILAEHVDHELGLLWFLSHDEAVPAPVRAEAQKLGLARDEFVDNGHWPWEIYVREARRIVGRYVFTERDAAVAPGIGRTPPHADGIAVAEWMMDSHDCNVERQPGSLYDGTFMLSEATRPSQIPYRCLLPQGIDNLLVPVCLSATHVAWGTIRLEPTWIHLAEAAGYALALAAAGGVPPARLDVFRLQRRLAESGVMLAFFNDLDMGTKGEWLAAVQYFGNKGFFDTYDARPEAPLRWSTAAIWIAAACDHLLGRLDAAERCREVAAAERRGEATVSGKEFTDQLIGQLRFHLGPEKAETRIRRLAAADPGGALSRGAACGMLYSLGVGNRGESGRLWEPPKGPSLAAGGG